MKHLNQINLFTLNKPINTQPFITFNIYKQKAKKNKTNNSYEYSN